MSTGRWEPDPVRLWGEIERRQRRFGNGSPFFHAARLNLAYRARAALRARAVRCACESSWPPMLARPWRELHTAREMEFLARDQL